MKTYMEYITEKKYVNILKPMYHGSRYIFDKFNLTSIGKDNHPLSYLGHHFTKIKSVAAKFAKRPEKNIYTVELYVNKTLKITESDLVGDILSYGYNNKYITLNDLNYILSLPYTGKFGENSFLSALNDDELDNIPFKKICTEYKKKLIEQNYDSIEYLNEVEVYDSKRYDWIVFNSNQIKILKIEKL
jgi:hypothetical protein